MDSETFAFRGGSRDAVGGQLIVKIDVDQQRDGASVLETALGADGFVVIHPADGRGMCLIEVTAAGGRSMEEAANALESDPAVVFVEPNDRVEQCAAIRPDDPLEGRQWNLDRINAPAVWAYGTVGPRRILIAVADSGIPMQGTELSHEDLSNDRTFLVGSDFTGTGELARDDNGHGTHVLGIASARRNKKGIVGLANTGATLSLKVFDSGGAGSAFWVYQAAIEALAVAASRSAKLVFNFSGRGLSPSRLWTEAASALSDGDALFVCAVGNDAGPVGFPAALSPQFDNVVAVGASTIDDQHASFSNTGPEVNVVAPGVDILSTLPDYASGGGFPLEYGTLSGTSMSAPLVSALAAAIWDRYSFYDAPRVRRRLEETAVDLGSAGRDPRFGFGRIDGRAALEESPVYLGEPMPKQFWPDAPVPPPDRSVLLNTVPGMGHAMADATWFCAIGNMADASRSLASAKDALLRGFALLGNALLDEAIRTPSKASIDAAHDDVRRATNDVGLYKAPWLNVRGFYDVGFHLRSGRWMASRDGDRSGVLEHIDGAKAGMADAKVYGTLYVDIDELREAVAVAPDAGTVMRLIDAFIQQTVQATMWYTAVIRP